MSERIIMAKSKLYAAFVDSNDIDVSYGIDKTTALLGVFDSIKSAKASIEAEHGRLDWDGNTADKEVVEENGHKVLKGYFIAPIEVNKAMDLCVASAFYLE